MLSHYAGDFAYPALGQAIKNKALAHKPVADSYAGKHNSFAYLEIGHVFVAVVLNILVYAQEARWRITNYPSDGHDYRVGREECFPSGLLHI